MKIIFKYQIAKFNILLRPKDEPTNIFCLPSGGYREPKGFYAQANIELLEGTDFERVISIKKDGKVCELEAEVLKHTFNDISSHFENADEVREKLKKLYG